jgi:ApbE superfamily uncharacterized protein (UPF0280 family)
LTGPAARWINRGRRLHLQHGPIDLIIEADGEEKNLAYEAAVSRFSTVLQELMDEIDLLRMPVARLSKRPQGSVAQHMVDAAQLLHCDVTTPMIAVAGGVADEVLTAMTAAATLQRACVNNGGDIAIFLHDGNRYKAGVVADPGNPLVGAGITICANDGVGGIATSGRHGRSLSGGIADAVTVLASSAVLADAAATFIANSVHTPSPAIIRVPATEVDPESDLGSMPVTVEVHDLTTAEVGQALTNGAACAGALCARKIIHAAYLHLNGCCKVVGAAQLTTATGLTNSEELLHA